MFIAPEKDAELNCHEHAYFAESHIQTTLLYHPQKYLPSTLGVPEKVPEAIPLACTCPLLPILSHRDNHDTTEPGETLHRTGEGLWPRCLVND